MIILIHPLYFIEIEGLPIASACRREWSEWEYRNRGEGICAWVVGRGVTGLCASAAGHWLIITPERCGSFAIHHLSPHMSRPFFEKLDRDIALHLAEVKAYKHGIVELRYEVRKSS